VVVRGRDVEVWDPPRARDPARRVALVRFAHPVLGAVALGRGAGRRRPDDEPRAARVEEEEEAAAAASSASSASASASASSKGLLPSRGARRPSNTSPPAAAAAPGTRALDDVLVFASPSLAVLFRWRPERRRLEEAARVALPEPAPPPHQDRSPPRGPVERRLVERRARRFAFVAAAEPAPPNRRRRGDATRTVAWASGPERLGAIRYSCAENTAVVRLEAVDVSESLRAALRGVAAPSGRASSPSSRDASAGSVSERSGDLVSD
jgi:hypothetical protein